MAATSLLILVSAAGFDQDLGYNVVAQYNDNDSPSNQQSVDTFFTIAESAPVVNARIIANCKDDHNTRYGTNFNVATPVVLIGAMV